MPTRVSSETEFWSTFGRLEHESLDFKRVATKDLATTIAAMSMTAGGAIVLGVDDDRAVLGCPLDQRTLDILTRASHDVGVEVGLSVVTVDGTDVTVVEVPAVSGRVVTTSNGRVVRRYGSDNQPLRGDSLTRFVVAQTRHPVEADPVPAVSLSDVDLTVVNQVLRAEGRSAVRRQTLDRTLIDLGVAVESQGTVVLTTAGVVMFARDPSAAVSGARVQVVRRDGVDHAAPTRDRRVLLGPLPTLVEAVRAWIDDHTEASEAVVGLRRERVPAYPTAVLREALLNALAHRDYGLAGSTVDITVFGDRLEIQSPGGLPGHVTVDNLRHEHYSRNPRIMALLKSLRLVDEFGEGVDRMISEMEVRLLPDPVWRATPSSVTVELRSTSSVSVADQVWLALLGNLVLTAAERRLLVLLRHEATVTRRRARDVVDDAHEPDLLAGLVAKGLIVRRGRRGGSYYELSDEILQRAGVRGVEAQSRKRHLLLLEVRHEGSLSVVEGVGLLGESRDVVRSLLADLVRTGDVIGRGNTRARRYFPVDRE